MAIPTQDTSAQHIVVAHAGSFTSVLHESINPNFTSMTGYPVVSIGGPSVDLAQQILAGKLQPDVFISADAEVNHLFMDQKHLAGVQWYFLLCRQRMVIAYNSQSRFAAEFTAAARGEMLWYDVLRLRGLQLKRSNPRVDPGGYRTLFVFQLAEQYYGIDGLREQILHGDENEQQIASGDYSGLVKNKDVDAVVTYHTNAIKLGVPVLFLPDVLDLSNPERKEFYATASYTTPQGNTVHGTPAVCSITIPHTVRNHAGAEAFLHYLLTASGRNILSQCGFLPVERLVGGTEALVPLSLRGLIQGQYER